MENVPGLPHYNMPLAAGVALIPLLLGFLWYNPKVFGNAWMKGAGLNEDSAKGMNMPLVFGLTYLFSLLLALFLHGWTMHNFAFSSLLMPEMGFTDPEGLTETLKTAAVMTEHKFRTFRHGAVHGVILSVMLALPLMAVGSLFERRGWKYILINWGYWLVSISLMSGIICQWA